MTIDIEYERKQITEYTERLIEKFTGEINRLKTLIPTEGETGVKQLLPYPELDFWNKIGTWQSAKTQLTQRMAIVEEWYKACLPIRDQNVSIAAHNQVVREAAMNFMKSLKVPTKVSYYKTSRSKYPDYKDAEWIGEIRKAIPADSGFSVIQRKYDDEKREFERKMKEIIAAEEKEAREKEKENKARLVTLAVFEVAKELGMEEPAKAGVTDVLERILNQNKYLDLAYAMQRNRSDWNDGCDYTESALGRFKVETDVDQQIVDSVSSHCGENWDGDGRIFRDCMWNYDEIFAKVALENPDLYRQFVKISNFVELN